MYLNFKNIILVSLLGVCCTLFAAGEISVQGVLRDPLGTTVEDGYYSISFKLYNVESGGTALWEETQGSVEIQHGVFSVELGTVNSMTDLTFIEDYWIGISVEGGTEMTPRTKLTTSPYSKAVFGIENVFPSYGSVGVGTTSPSALLEIIENESNSTDDLLHMQNSANATQLRVEDDGTMTIPNGGALGVGIDVPEAVVHVEASSAGQDILLIKDSDGVDQVKVDSDGDMTITSDLVVGSAGSINFPDGSSLVSADFGGAASSVTSPSNAEIGADNTGSGAGAVNFNINGVTKASILNNGNADFTGALDVTGNTDIGGALNVIGNAVLGGRDIATDGAKLDGIAAGATNVTNNNQISNGSGYLDASTKTFGNSDGITTLSSGKNTSDWPYPTFTDFRMDVYGRDNNIEYWDYLIARMYSVSNNDNDGINYGFNCRGSFNSNSTWNFSDNRLKHNEINITNGLELVRKMVPRKYDKTDIMLGENYNGSLSNYNYMREAGIIAQDLLEIEELKDYVKLGSSYPGFDDEENSHAVNYNSLFTYGLAAVKELDVIVQDQKNIIDSQEATIQDLIKRIEALEKSR